MKLLGTILAVLIGGVPAGQAFLKPLQQRDSILIADQLEYGFRLDSLKDGTSVLLPDFSAASNDTLTLVRGWQLDTLRSNKRTGLRDISASIVLAPFEEGKYELPDLPVIVGGDTLVFSGLEMDVKTIPVDTANFEIRDIKGQIRYPLTFKEVLPWSLGAIVLAALIVLLVLYIRRRRAMAAGELAKHRDPAYIVALRELDKYRSDKYWAPEKQKAFYSGITDALKFYIEDRFGIDAPEMTTAELFGELRKNKDLAPELYEGTKELFECADFVKFAKHIASDEDNAKALPMAVRFVTSTYQTELEEEQGKDVL